MAEVEDKTGLVRRLCEAGKTHADISSALQLSGVPRCSEMYIRTFCIQHDTLLERCHLLSLVRKEPTTGIT